MTSLLNENDLARYLGVSLAACRKWRTQGRGPTFIKLGSLVRYRSEDVEQWLATRPQGGEDSFANAPIGGIQ